MTETVRSVMVVYGTRPEAIKVAPLIRVLNESESLRPIVVATAQHREMLDQVNRVFGLLPDIDLDIMKPGQTLNSITAVVIEKLDQILLAERPDAVLVQGDTTTVMSAAIAAFNREIPVIHLEAGLRSGDVMSPFPEEANRKIVSQIASLNLAPTESARSNLLRDGVSRNTISVTGNTVIDALQWAVKQPVKYSDLALKVLENETKRMMLVTAHRRENLGRKMVEIAKAVKAIAQRNPDLIIVWPLHRNPAVRSAVKPHIENLSNILAIEPVDYNQFSHLIARSEVVLTDSGGVQEEAPSLGKPVLVMRENTERPEAVKAGTARLVGTSPHRIVNEVERLLRNSTEYSKMSEAINPYGDGNAARYCCDLIERLLLHNISYDPTNHKDERPPR